MKKILFVFLTFSILFSCNTKVSRIYLDELDLTKMEQEWGDVQINKSVEGNPLLVGGTAYTRGVGTHSVSKLMLDLHGKGSKFHALVGVDDESGEQASVGFFILGDRNILWQSGLMKKGDPARQVELNLSKIGKLALFVSNGGDHNYYDHADWLDAWIEYRKTAPETALPPVQEKYILTPPVSDTPCIHGPVVYGVRTGHPFLYRIPVTGKEPLTCYAEGLPDGLSLDGKSGIISGTCNDPGDYLVKIAASNDLWRDEMDFLIKVGQAIALTPPMGWNSWNCWGLSVDQQKVQAAADAMIESRLADHGWTYINIDDGWEADARTASGELPANGKFPDMKALAGYIHEKGLKLGIYSSPGPKTCGGFLGSWEHELQDARTWKEWGIDYLKYDWCSYGEKAVDESLPELKKPYLTMRKALDQLDRDIVFSLCQYGMGDVWQWGAEAGGNLWRTTGDITDTWGSMAGIGFDQDKSSPYARPGGWNDPDMLVVGQVGWGPDLHATRLTPDEQYTHISLWCLLSAPLLLGCDLSQLDEFTLNLLTNDEVLAVDQDPYGQQAKRVKKETGQQVWAKRLYDGSLAVGLFNTGDDSPAGAFTWTETQEPDTVSVKWEDLRIFGPRVVRDLWRQEELGTFDRELRFPVNNHGVLLVNLSEVR
jgi:alpha-galactosidase